MTKTINYFVVADSKRVSRVIATVGTLRRVLKRTLRHEPTAYAVQEKHYR